MNQDARLPKNSIVIYPAGARLEAPLATGRGYLVLEGVVRLERRDGPPRLLAAGDSLTRTDLDQGAVAATDCRLARLEAAPDAQRESTAEGDPLGWALHW